MTTCTTRAAETWAHILAAPDGRTLWMAAADYAREEHDGTPEEVATAACAAVEAVAQQHLDAHPDDHRARRLLGEWLQWHGDERGEGYRALAACGLRPFESKRRVWVWFSAAYYGLDPSRPHCLPGDWYARLGRVALNYEDWPTRRAAEDAAALAFARLPAERRAALLRGEM